MPLSPDDDDDYSSLSELESDGGDYTNKGKGKAKVSDEYRLTNVIKAPRGTTYTPQALYDQILAGDVELSPEYQRDVVWSSEKQTALIDSILSNFYVPPVIFGLSPGEDEMRTCIDGKQRLTSIRRFMDGEIPHRDPKTKQKYWFKIVPGGNQGRSPKQLPEKYRKAFLTKQIVCVEYHALTDEQERDIFKRVQMGMALSANEKLQVGHSERRTFLRDLVNKYFNDGQLNIEEMVWVRTRGTDFRVVTQAAMHITKGKVSSRSIFATTAQIMKWLDVEEDFSVEDKANFHDIFRRLVRVFDAHPKTSSTPIFGEPSKLAPVEVIGILVLVAERKGTYADEDLRQSIVQMRRVVRKEHSDVRLNDRIGKTMMSFISMLPERAPSSKVMGKRPSMYESDDDRPTKRSGVPPEHRHR